jgi:hypothetical protein
MSEARSLTPLSETDYEAIEAAVMETARGRWFMAEFAKRNRQADTAQLLSAIGRIERVVGLNAPQPTHEPNLAEAAALIGDLRIDLERISGKGEARSSGLAARIEGAAGTIIAATESVQEAAWILREAGADDALCNLLDRHAAEISAAITVVDGAVQRIDKIADTIAMLDSSLRVFSDMATPWSHGNAEQAAAPPPERVDELHLREVAPLASYDDLEIVEIGNHAAPAMAESRLMAERSAADVRIGTIQRLEDDIVFSDIGSEAAPQPPRPSRGTSEAALRDIEALPAERKLAYFA